MRVAEISLENFRSFRDRTTIKIGARICAFVGANGSGKSNILEALRWANRSLRAESTRNPEEIRHTTRKSDPIRLGITFEPDKEERAPLLESVESIGPHKGPVWSDGALFSWIRWEVSWNPGMEQPWGDELFVANHDGEPMTLFAKKEDSSFARYEIDNALKGMAERGKIVPREVQKFKGLPSAPLGTWNNRDIAGRVGILTRETVAAWTWLPPTRTVSTRIEPKQAMRVSPEGANLVQVLNTLQTEDPEDFVLLARRFARVVPGLQKVTAPLRGAQVTSVLREVGNVEFELSSASSGTVEAMLLLTQLRTLPPKTTVLIDEPELHLHAGSQRAIHTQMSELARELSLQILITTHSTIFARPSSDSRVNIVRKEEGTSKVREVTTEEVRSITESLGHDPTDLFGHRAVVMIEGDSEEVAFPILAAGRGLDLAAEGILLLNLRGAGNAQRVEVTLKYLRAAGVLAFLILDGGSPVAKHIKRWNDAGLLEKENTVIWEREFEDNFSDEVLMSAIAEIYGGLGVKAGMTANDLVYARNQGKSVVGPISASYFAATGRSIRKPELAEHIAKIVVRRGSEETEPEKAVSRIHDRVRRAVQ